MWLIEYDTGKFVNAEQIQCVDVCGGIVGFLLPNGSEFCVSAAFAETFVNHLQALNNNIQSIQSRYYELKSDEGE